MEYIDELQEAFLKNILIPVIGAGVSRPFGLPDWGDLLRICAKKYNLPTSAQNKLEDCLQRYEYLDAADAIIHGGITEEQLCQCVAETMSDAKRCISDDDKAGISNNYTDLAMFSGVRYMTTNYDRYLNDFTDGKSFKLTELTQIDVNMFSFKEYDNRIIPLHGEITEPESIVLSRKAYEAVYEDEDFELAFQHIRSSFVFLFIGFSFDDIYVKGMFEHILHKRLASRHYVLFGESMKKSHSEKIAELEEKYGVKSIYYKVEDGDHIYGIRHILREIYRYRDRDVDLSGLPKLKDKEGLTGPADVLDMISKGEEARRDERVSDAEGIFLELHESEEYFSLPADTKLQILVNLMWCRGMVFDFDGTEAYIDEIDNDEKLRERKEKCVFIYAQLLWNQLKFEKAIDVLKTDGVKKSKTRLVELFSDICRVSIWRFEDVDATADRIPIYGEKPWSKEYKAEAKKRYLSLRSKYINPDTFNLTDIAEYEDNVDLEYAYYWMGNVAGQMFHEHGDAIQFFLRAKEYRDSRLYDECLGVNYLELAKEKIRYRKNTKAFDIDKTALEKSWRCFRISFRTGDDMLLHSMYERMGGSFLNCLFLMRHDYEFEEFWEQAYDHIEKDETLWLFKAEVDARYLFKNDKDVVCHLSEMNRLYVRLVKWYEMAAYYRSSGITDRSERFYKRLIRELEHKEAGKSRIERFCEEGEYRFLHLELDACLFLQDLDGYRRLRCMAEKYGAESEGDPMLMAFELELQNNWDGAEALLCDYYHQNRDNSTFMILNGIYHRRAQACLTDDTLSLDERNELWDRCRTKSRNLYEELLDEKGSGVFDAISFYRSYILNELNTWHDIPRAIELYLRFCDEMNKEPDLLIEVEEILKPLLFDFSDVIERVIWNRKMLTISPREVHHQFYRNILRLYMANFEYDKAWELWNEIIPTLEMKHPEITPEYSMLAVLTAPVVPLLRSDGRPRRFSFDLIRQIRSRLEVDKRYKRMCFGAKKQCVIIPMEVIFALFQDGRRLELDEFDAVYVPYAYCCQMQMDLSHHEYTWSRSVLGWLMDEKSSARLFSPPFYDAAAVLAENPGSSPEWIQIKAFLKSSSNVRLLFEDYLR